MSKPNFTWEPDLGAQQKLKPNVTQTKFGDGYELRVATGVNLMPRVWTVTFTKPATEAVAILSFLEARQGLEAFSWKDPMGYEGVFVCREWSASQSMQGLYQVSGTFEQVFEF